MNPTIRVGEDYETFLTVNVSRYCYIKWVTNRAEVKWGGLLLIKFSFPMKCISFFSYVWMGASLREGVYPASIQIAYILPYLIFRQQQHSNMSLSQFLFSSAPDESQNANKASFKWQQSPHPELASFALRDISQWLAVWWGQSYWEERTVFVCLFLKRKQ